ncbi:MAG: flagellar hook-associated protein FlgK [Pigmentiphaga sp.]|nr:flagellar hook-associated protein FlgK [Pigmentiphaga sp.]
MSNLFNLGRRGLSAAQMGLNVTGHNITNVNTPGFSRQQAMVSTTNAQGTGAGYVGTGVQVDTVRRIYDAFLSQQLNAATSNQAATSAYADQMSRINNLLSDRTVGVGEALSRFFEGMNAVASQPAEPAARQELIGRAESLVSQFTVAQRFLQDQSEGLNQQIETTIASINSYAERINDLNQRIITSGATVFGQPANDLLDQRDQLINELSALVGVTVVDQGDRVNLTVGNGQTLISGNQVYPLTAVRSAADPTRLAVAYTAASGVQVELADDVIKGGKLGGLLEYRSDALDDAMNELGRVALGLAVAFNEQHAQGAGLDGQPGGDFFGIGAWPATALGNSNNASATPVYFEIADISQVTDSEYTVSYSTADGYLVTRHSDGAKFRPADPQELGGFELDGLRFILQQDPDQPPPSPPADGDSYLVQPVRYAARDITVAISDPSRIAASAYDADDATLGGSANGTNALALAQLQTGKILGNGSMSVTEAYSQLVNHVGVKAAAVNTALSAQTSLKEQAFQAQQAVSGVNLNEEYINLDFYVQQYNASARLIDVGTSLFDTLLGLGR